MFLNSTRITVKPTPSISPEEARNARANALRFALDCYAKKKAAECATTPDGPNKQSANTRRKANTEEVNNVER